MTPTNLYQKLIKTVLTFPNRPLFHVDNLNKNIVTYNDFIKSVNNFRNILIKNNIQKGDNVVIIGNNSHNWASLAFAIWAEGAVLIPMYEKQTNNVKNYVINQTNPKILFNSGNKMNHKLEFNHDKIIFTENNKILNNANVCENDLATILYTSGTTGSPKGVMLTHYNIMSNIESISKHGKNMEITENDKYVSFLPWAHCYGLNCELIFLMTKGASTYLNTNLNPPVRLINDFVRHNPTILCGVPKLFADIDKKTWYNKYFPNCVKREIIKKVFGKNLRFAMIGGASINSSVLNYYNDCGVSLYQGYGMTETAPLVSSNTIGENKIGSVGKLLDCNSAKFIDGEIYVNGSNVSDGYYLHPNHESFVTIDGKKYFKTGDSGHLDENQYLYVTGRIKETYKLSNGKFINPDEIERIILQIPEVHQVMIYAKSEDQFNRLIAVTTLSKDQLKQKISKLKLEKFKIPHTIMTTTESFTLENGLVTPKQSLKRKEIIQYFKL